MSSMDNILSSSDVFCGKHFVFERNIFSSFASLSAQVNAEGWDPLRLGFKTEEWDHMHEKLEASQGRIVVVGSVLKFRIDKGEASPREVRPFDVMARPRLPSPPGRPKMSSTALSH